jgi:hypothetical protein
MATVNAFNSGSYVGSSRALDETPFFSRNYGGFSKEQWAFFKAHAGSLEGKKILDPMAGQAFYLSQLAWEGSSVSIGDINPAPLLLALLRDPEVIVKAESLTKWFMARFSRLKYSKSDTGVNRYCDEWIAPNIKDQIAKYVEIFGLEHFQLNSENREFWNLPVKLRFASALPVLAARQLTCFRSSDNFTWLKRGGLQREQSIQSAILRALEGWGAYARDQSAGGKAGHIGNLRVSWMDAERGYFADCKKVDVLVTSPAYANRLDYTSLWAPELAVVAEMFGIRSDEIKATQIGSTVVRNKPLAFDEEKMLPKKVRRALTEIRADTASAASGSYYYPFFSHYAIGIMRMLDNVERRVRKNGRMLFFVRDTVRKDTLFPTGLLIEGLLARLGWRLTDRKKIIVRHHLGMKRRSARSGPYGFAQTEWWLAFERKNA